MGGCCGGGELAAEAAKAQEAKDAKKKLSVAAPYMAQAAPAASTNKEPEDSSQKAEPKPQPAAPPPQPVDPAPSVTPVKPAPVQAQPPEPVAQPAPPAPKEAMKVVDAVKQGVLERGSCLEVFSNSYNAWCPGVIINMDTQSLHMAYQIPGEPADANISTKTLAIESEELRLPLDATDEMRNAGDVAAPPWLTASVEVYSHSNKAWCLGKVTEIKDGVASIVFFYPNEPPDAVPVMKQLQLGDTDLRLRGIDAAFQEPAVGHENLQVGSPVEIFSHSQDQWIEGKVKDFTDDGQVIVEFYYADMDRQTEPPVEKVMPLGHQDLRCAEGPTEEELMKVWQGPTKKIEVYSASRQVWIVSTIKEIKDGMITVQLKYPDMPDDQLHEKELPCGDSQLRIIG